MEWHGGVGNLLVVALLEEARVGRVGDVERHDGQDENRIEPNEEEKRKICLLTRPDTRVWGVGDGPFGAPWENLGGGCWQPGGHFCGA